MKSAALHWEFMYTRSMFNTPDIAEQGNILQQVAKLVDEGKLQGTLSDTLHGFSIENLEKRIAKLPKAGCVARWSLSLVHSFRPLPTERPECPINADVAANDYVLVSPDALVRYVPAGYASWSDLDFHALAADANLIHRWRYR